MATGTAIHNLQHCPDERTGQGEGGPAPRTTHAVTMRVHICSILHINCFDPVGLYLFRGYSLCDLNCNERDIEVDNETSVQGPFHLPDTSPPVLL